IVVRRTGRTGVRFSSAGAVGRGRGRREPLGIVEGERPSAGGSHLMSGNVIVAGVGTPIGRLLGGLRSLSAAELGGVAIKGALEKAGASGDQVNSLITGHVILAGPGQNPARTAGLHAGLPLSLPSITINKVCLSGLNAIATADQLIRAGEAERTVAGALT